MSAITERRIMGLYEVPLSMSLLGFGMGTKLGNFHMCDIKSSFQHAAPSSQQSPPSLSPAPPTEQICDDSTFNVLQLNSN